MSLFLRNSGFTPSKLTPPWRAQETDDGWCRWQGHFLFVLLRGEWMVGRWPGTQMSYRICIFLGGEDPNKGSWWGRWGANSFNLEFAVAHHPPPTPFSWTGRPVPHSHLFKLRVRREWKRKSFVTAGKTWLMNRNNISHRSFFKAVTGGSQWFPPGPEAQTISSWFFIKLREGSDDQIYEC